MTSLSRQFRSTRTTFIAIGVTAAVAAALGVAVVESSGPGDGAGSALAGAPNSADQKRVPASGSALEIAIAKAQTRLETVPGDRDTWAELGLAYIQQARVTSDPSYYPKAEGVLKRSLAIGDQATNSTAMAGMGALANARHEFSTALDWANRAHAVNPYNATTYGIEDDALTQLGRYDEADAAAQKMLNLQPGIPSFSRASYHFEEKGQVDDARFALQKALDLATDPSDIAFCHYYLGELAFNSGDAKGALTQYALGLKADPSYDPLLAGQAKASAALGDSTVALKDYATVTERVPQPQYLIEYAELLQSLGRTSESQQQFALLDAEKQLFAANGVVDDLTSAVVDADHGSPASAVSHARAEWSRRHSVLVADALAWALHRAGQDEEALTYATQANRLGWKNATFRYHLGAIELALGQKDKARADLSAALAINRHFSLLQAPVAQTALASLGDKK